MTADRSAPAVDDADLVNGPEDVLGDWDEVEWRRVEQDVRRLRQRIFTASQAGDLKRVRNLQKLMLRSRANTLVSVRRVTERNAGRATAGIDGEVALTSAAKTALAVEVHRRDPSWQARPVKRIYIPKASGRHGSNRGPMGFARAVAATTRSRRSTGRSTAGMPSGSGFSTPTVTAAFD